MSQLLTQQATLQALAQQQALAQAALAQQTNQSATGPGSSGGNASAQLNQQTTAAQQILAAQLAQLQAAQLAQLGMYGGQDLSSLSNMYNPLANMGLSNAMGLNMASLAGALGVSHTLLLYYNYKQTKTP